MDHFRGFRTHTTTFNMVSYGSPSVTIYSDASLSGWGGVLNDVSSGGLFSEEEQTPLIILRFWLVFSHLKLSVLV